MATQLDEGVGNLERLCGLLAQTNDALKGHSSGLESRANEYEEREDAAQEALGELGEAATDVLDRVKDSGGDATAAVDGLAESARALGDTRLTGVEQDLQAAESAFEQKAEADRASLEGDFSELTANGFEALASGVEAAQGGLQASGQETAGAFDAFEGAVQASAQEVESFQSATVAGLSEAADGLTGEVAQGLASDGSDCVSAWMDELPSEVEAGCSAAEGPVAAAYAAFGDEGVGAGDELIERVSTVSSEAAGFVLDEEGGHLEEAGATAIEHGIPELQAEMGNLQATVDAGAETAGVLEPMVGELETSKSVVTEVDQLLNAIGG